MKKIVIITVSILIVLIVLISPMGSISPYSTGTHSKATSFPYGSISRESEIGFVNSSALHFCTTYSEHSGNYFNLSGRNYKVNTGMFVASTSCSLQIPLSWNENNSYTMTESYLNISYGNVYIHGKFGLLSNSSLEFCEPGKQSINFSFEENTYYYLFFQYISTGFYFSLSNSSEVLNQHILIPLLSSDTLSSGLNVSVKGYYYNLKIGTPDSDSSYNFFNPVFSHINYRNVNTSRFYSSESAQPCNPVSCCQNGTYLLGIDNHTVSYYNSITNASRILFSINGTIVSDANSPTSTFWLIKNNTSTYSLLKLCRKTGSITSIKLRFNGTMLTGISSTEYGLFVCSSSGIFVINQDNGSLSTAYTTNCTEQSFIRNGLCCYDGQIFQIASRNNTVKLTELNRNVSKVFENVSEIYLHEESSGLKTVGIAIHGSGSLILYAGSGVISSKQILQYSPTNISYCYSKNSIAFQNSRRTFLIKTEGSYMGSMKTTIFTLYRGEMNFYNFANLTGPEINITASSSYLFSPSGTFNYDLQNGSVYNATIVVSNHAIDLGNLTNKILNLSFLSSGSYIYTLTVETQNLFYASASGIFIVDNSYPKFRFSPGLIEGVYGGEKINVTIDDCVDIVNSTMYISGVSHRFEGSDVSFTVPFIRSSELRLKFVVTDGFGVVRNQTFSLPYFNDSHVNIQTNIISGEILNKGSFNFSITGSLQNYTSVNISLVVNNKSLGNLTFRGRVADVSLQNGAYTYKIWVKFRGNLTLVVDQGNFSVMAFEPRFNVHVQSHTFYSFFTNSYNDSFYYHFTSNLTGTWLTTLVHDNHIIYSSSNRSEQENVSSRLLIHFLHGNGTYTIAVRFISLNNFTFYRNYVLNVSNEAPSFNGTTEIYTNKTVISLWNSILIPNLRTFILQNGVYEPFNGIMHMNRTGYYNISVEFVNIYGSRILKNFSVGYSDVAPVITVGDWHNHLQSSSKQHLSVRVNSPFGISSLSLKSNYSTIESNGDNYTIAYHSDGTYHLFIYAIGKTGNRAVYELNTTVTYFTTLTGIIMAYSVFFLNFKGSVNLSGNATLRAQVVWLMNGKTIGSGNDLNHSFSMGYHILEVKASYGNTSVERTIRFFTLNAYVLLIPLIGLIIYPTYSGIVTNRDSRELIENLLEMDDCPLRDVVRNLSKKHFKKRKVIKAIELMETKGLLKMTSDPDGRKILEFVSKHKKE